MKTLHISSRVGIKDLEQIAFWAFENLTRSPRKSYLLIFALEQFLKLMKKQKGKVELTPMEARGINFAPVVISGRVDPELFYAAAAYFEEGTSVSDIIREVFIQVAAQGTLLGKARSELNHDALHGLEILGWNFRGVGHKSSITTALQLDSLVEMEDHYRPEQIDLLARAIRDKRYKETTIK